eukprot:scaffold1598_cov285-Prasinococcus_capsulatus_cf.AAC.1
MTSRAFPRTPSRRMGGLHVRADWIFRFRGHAAQRIEAHHPTRGKRAGLPHGSSTGHETRGPPVLTSAAACKAVEGGMSHVMATRTRKDREGARSQAPPTLRY